MRAVQYKVILASIFGLGLVLRLLFSLYGNHPDILSLAGWGQWLFQHGTKGFYENNIWVYAWPTQAPLFNLIMLGAHLGYEYTLNTMRFLNFNVVPHLAPGHMLWWFEWIKW